MFIIRIVSFFIHISFYCDTKIAKALYIYSYVICMYMYFLFGFSPCCRLCKWKLYSYTNLDMGSALHKERKNNNILT